MNEDEVKRLVYLLDDNLERLEDYHKFLGGLIHNARIQISAIKRDLDE